MTTATLSGAFASAADFTAALGALTDPDPAAIAAARARQGQLTKPPGSLGRLEDLAVFLAGWQGTEKPSLQRGRTAIFAGNHGVTVHGVSAFPAEVTVQMVANFAAGGAAINQLAKAAGLELQVVPLDLDTPTADFTQGPAMSEAECLAAINAGAATVDPGLQLLTVGEMGIGNTTSAAALAAISFGGNAADWVGAGTGVDDAGLVRKRAVVEQALTLHAPAAGSAFDKLARVGGREIAAIAGAVLRARQLRIPVLLDGFITCAAIAPLAVEAPGITAHCLAGHCSAEQGHGRMLGHLGLEPLLRLDMRLGEGSGAAVAAHILRSALAAHNGMATFAEAGVADG
ncbi:MAG TPA: nicotinate-nucleotide--dimethylbenzimidazole phosphoribosyltransferase [Sphingobium sp.]|uniref:nicotinate-nucleotide--dimethylbenzimidazole phosphoribosyltransferase n=1 Tax=Sphingobium sp. TaxID=1912891 RepID=UPI002ED33F5A